MVLYNPKFVEEFNKYKKNNEVIDDIKTLILESFQAKTVKRTKSSSWSHFKVFSFGRIKNYAICNHCHEPISRSSISNLSNHIISKHKVVNQTVARERLEEYLSTSTTPSSLFPDQDNLNENKQQQDIKKFLDNNVDIPEKRLIDFVIAFLLASNSSLQLVELQEFKDLISFTRQHKNTKLPCVKSIKARMHQLEVATTKSLEVEIKSLPIAITHDGAKSHNGINIDVLTGIKYEIWLKIYYNMHYIFTIRSFY